MQKAPLRIGLRKSFWLKKLKILFHGYSIELSGEIKQSSELKKYSTEKMIKCSSKGKVMKIHLIVGLIKKILLYKMSYFSEPYNCSKNKIKVEIHLSNYATKSDLKT